MLSPGNPPLVAIRTSVRRRPFSREWMTSFESVWTQF